MQTHLSPPSRFDLELDSSLSSDSKNIWLLRTFSISMLIENVTSGLKSGWCEKHNTIKENETMTIKIIRSTQITAFFLSSAGHPPIYKLVYCFNTGTEKKPKY
jgi:hypothetical protein